MELKQNNTDNSAKVVLEAPNGGWGYVIIVGISVMFICSVFSTRVFGLVFGSFLSELGDEVEEISLIQSVFGTTVSLMGFFTNYLLRNCPKRIVGFVGATIYFIGSSSTIFVTTFPQIVLTFAILQGIGYGTFSPVMYQSLHEYFTTRRTFANSLVGLICGFLDLFLPMTFQFCKDFYGFRGAAAILAAMSLNVFPIILLAQPVKWHMIKTTISPIASTIEPQNYTSEPTENSVNNKIENAEENSKRIDIEDKISPPKLLTRIKHALIHFFDLTLLQDIKFVNLVFGTALMHVTDSSFVILVPSIYARRGYDKSEIVFALTIYAIANITARVIQTITSSLFPIRCRYLVYSGAVSLITLRFLFAFFTEPLHSFIILCLMGFARAWFIVYMIACLADYDVKRFPGVLGLHLIIVCFAYMILGPFIGWLSRTFQRDEFIIITMAAIPSLSYILWTVEFIVNCLNKKKA